MGGTAPNIRNVDPDALRAATRIAGGDLRRLDFLPDGSVVVRSHPRPGTGAVPSVRPARAAAEPPPPPTTGTRPLSPLRSGAGAVPPETSAELSPAYRFSSHALDRCREFGIAPGIIGHIIERPDVDRPGTNGARVLLRDDVPMWAAVVARDEHSGITTVVTVVRRTYERWEHG